MIGKRGLSYVDWVISLGTFLVAILLVFVLIRPQLEPYVGKENLVKTVEETIYGSIEWSVWETPVVVKKLADQYNTGSGSEQVRIKVWYDENVDYTISLPENSRLQAFEGTPITIQCSSGLCVNEGMTIISFPRNPPQEREYISPSLTCSPEDETLCDATLGATLTTIGLSRKKFEEIQSKGYSKIKEEIKLPSAAEFAIRIGTEMMFDMPNTPATGNVYVSERDYWWLTKENERLPVKVYVEVW